jgi:hypothetical protein
VCARVCVCVCVSVVRKHVCNNTLPHGMLCATCVSHACMSMVAVCARACLSEHAPKTRGWVNHFCKKAAKQFLTWYSMLGSYKLFRQMAA